MKSFLYDWGRIWADGWTGRRAVLAGGLGSGSGKAVAKQKCKKLSFQTFHGFVCHQQIAKPKDQSQQRWNPAKLHEGKIQKLWRDWGYVAYGLVYRFMKLIPSPVIVGFNVVERSLVLYKWTIKPATKALLQNHRRPENNLFRVFLGTRPDDSLVA